jgi:hypothetical protein
MATVLARADGHGRARAAVNAVPRDLIARTAAFLLLKESMRRSLQRRPNLNV